MRSSGGWQEEREDVSWKIQNHFFQNPVMCFKVESMGILFLPILSLSEFWMFLI